MTVRSLNETALSILSGISLDEGEYIYQGREGSGTLWNTPKNETLWLPVTMLQVERFVNRRKRRRAHPTAKRNKYGLESALPVYQCTL